MIFKRNLIDNDKKLLHKVKKNWVVVSVAALSLLGLGSVAGQTVSAHADSNNGQQTNSTQSGQQNSNISTTGEAKSATTGGNNQIANGQAVPNQSVIDGQNSQSQDNVTINYVNQNGNNVGSRMFNTSSDVSKNPSQFAPVPDGYSLNTKQDPAITTQGNQKTYQYGVIGNQIQNSVSVNLTKEHYQGDNYANPTWSNENTGGPVDNQPTKTISIPVSGRVGDFYMINQVPLSDIPTGYTVDPNNQAIVGQFTPNGVSKGVGTFNYDPDKAQILFNLVDSQDYAVMPSFRLTGHADDAGMVDSFIKLPNGYYFDDGDTRTFRMQPNDLSQVMDLRVNGAQFDPKNVKNYANQITANLVDKTTNKSLGKQTLSVTLPSSIHYGDVRQISIQPGNFSPKNYVAASPDYTATVRFDPNGVKILDPAKNAFENLSDVSLQFSYLSSDGASASNNTNLGITTANSNTSNSSNGNGASSLTDVTVKYVDQAGHSIASSTKAVRAGQHDLTQLVSIPADYQLATGQKTNVNVPSNGGQYTLNVLGQVTTNNVQVTLNANPAKNDPYAPKQATAKTINVSVTGRIGDKFNISRIPSNDIPAGYLPDSNNRAITGEITKNGLTTKNGTFNYDPRAANITLNVLNRSGQAVENPISWNGHVGDTVNLDNLVGKLPRGMQRYGKNLGTVTINGNHLQQTYTVPVQGDLIHPDASYNHTIVFGLVRESGKQMIKMGTADVMVNVPKNVRLGDTEDVKINPADFEGSVYYPLTQIGDCLVQFNKHGIRILNPNTSEFVNPDSLSLAYELTSEHKSQPSINTNTDDQASGSNDNMNNSPEAANPSSASTSQSTNSHSAQAPSSASSKATINSGSNPSFGSSSVSQSNGPASSSIMPFSFNFNFLPSQSNSTPSSVSAANSASASSSAVNNDLSVIANFGSVGKSATSQSNQSVAPSAVNSSANNMFSLSISNVSSNSSSSANINSVSNNFVSGTLDFVAPTGKTIVSVSIGGPDGTEYVINDQDPLVSMNMPAGYKIAPDVIQNAKLRLKSGQNNNFELDIEPAKHQDQVSSKSSKPAVKRIFVRILRTVQIQHSPNFRKNRRLLTFRKGQVVEAFRVVKSRRGLRRYELYVNGKKRFITAGRRYTRDITRSYGKKVNSKKSYYRNGEVPSGYVQVMSHSITSYRRPRMSRRNAVQKYWRHEIIRVVSVVRRHGANYFKLADGTYISANKRQVQAFEINN